MKRGVYYGLGAVAGAKILGLAAADYAAEFGRDKLQAILR